MGVRLIDAYLTNPSRRVTHFSLVHPLEDGVPDCLSPRAALLLQERGERRSAGRSRSARSDPAGEGPCVAAVGNLSQSETRAN